MNDKNRIRIDTGTKRILINDGPEFIEFNPSDAAFAQQFYEMLQHFSEKQKELELRAEELDKNTEKDEMGIAKNAPEGIQLIMDVCLFMRSEIDALFGPDTSKKVFGAINNLNMFEQFFTGILPFIQGARESKIQKYTMSSRPKPVRSKHKKKLVAAK